MWQDGAFKEWRVRLQANGQPLAVRLIEDLSLSDQVPWLRCFGRDPHPVAGGIARWLSRMDSRPWIVVPGDSWNIIENPSVVLAAYPEYLEWDPLAMCGLAVLWAGSDRSRWDTVAALLGPVGALGALEGLLNSPDLGVRWASFERAYQPFLDAWNLRVHDWQHDEASDLSAPWSEVPDYQEYREQLEFGVVPHGTGGEGVANEIAVLLALYEMPESTRPMMAGLAFKALEGLWMIDAWRRVR